MRPLRVPNSLQVSAHLMQSVLPLAAALRLESVLLLLSRMNAVKVVDLGTLSRTITLLLPQKELKVKQMRAHLLLPLHLHLLPPLHLLRKLEPNSSLVLALQIRIVLLHAVASNLERCFLAYSNLFAL
jgi:hypothetical protein